MLKSGREAALKALAAYRRSGAWSDIFLNNLAQKEELSKRELSLASAICFGVLQNTALLDFYISSYCSVKLSKLEPMVLDILRVSAYQILFFEKIPHSAAVNEGVKLTKKHSNPRAAGLVNAVLRKISANANTLPEIPKDDINRYLAVKYSHPEKLVALFREIFSDAECEKLLSANNEKPNVNLQINTLRTNVDTLLSALREQGTEADFHPWLKNCVEVSSAGAMEDWESFKNGDFYVQDPAARLAVTAADLKPGMFVIDVCSAPGGKSFAAAVDMQNTGRIVSCDIHEKKLNLIENSAKRLGIDIIETRAADARIPIGEFYEKADAVIADVPCSGMGIIRKKPEIRYKGLEELKGLPDIQLEILKNVSDYVKPGGVLIYSTCTILKQENEGVVHRFIKEDDRFELEPFTLPGAIGKIDGMITLYPHTHRTDGFFICKLRRKK